MSGRECKKILDGLLEARLNKVVTTREDEETFVKDKGLVYEKTSTHLFLYVKDGQGIFKEIAARFGEESVTLRTANLEDVFLKATGRALNERQ